MTRSNPPSRKPSREPPREPFRQPSSEPSLEPTPTVDDLLRTIQFGTLPQNIISNTPTNIPSIHTPLTNSSTIPTTVPPSISISTESNSLACDFWKDAIIIRVWHSPRNTGELADKLSKIWKLKGNLYLIPQGHNTYLGTFSVIKEKWYALLHGPCRISGHLISVRPWIPRYRASHHLQEAWSSVWIKLNDIPVEFFQNTILVNIGNTIGSFLATDPVTHNLHKASFARMCVLIDLATDLPSEVVVDGCALPISYEGNLGLCTNCGASDHHRNIYKTPAYSHRQGPFQNQRRPNSESKLPFSNSNSNSKLLSKPDPRSKPKKRALPNTLPNSGPDIISDLPKSPVRNKGKQPITISVISETEQTPFPPNFSSLGSHSGSSIASSSH